jgi:hypothetical protein
VARKISIGLAAAGIIGIMISFVIWHSASTYMQSFLSSGKPFHDQTVITAIVEDSIHNPDVQQILRTQIMLYLKSPEGKAKLVEMMKSPEMIKATADNLKSPELRPAVIQLMHDPAFRETLVGIVRDAPEMRVLRVLESAIEWNIPAESSSEERKD